MLAERHAILAEVEQPKNVSAPFDLERVVLGAREGVTASTLPPVRIFLGTETAQHRAERIFVWSIEKVRDPSRVYEITFMKELPGFNPRRWLTGFTNYRFAIPALAGCTGRAIYNDVDQIYLSDPAEMFDLPMDEHGFMSISDRDTSVMLIDCARMAAVWPLAAVQQERRKQLEERARQIAGLWGPLDHGWNARDDEYQAGRSHLIHFTVLQTQPWRPLPYRFVYQANPVAPVWEALEQDADAAGFHSFSARRPSAKFTALTARAAAGELAGPAFAGTPDMDAWRGLSDILDRPDITNLIHYTLADADPGVEARRHNPLTGTLDKGQAAASGVLCSQLLEYLPDEDVPWMLDQMFRVAGRFLFLVVDDQGRSAATGPARRTRHKAWWLTLLEGAARRQPGVHWRMALHIRHIGGRMSWGHYGGGHSLNQPPKIWILDDDKVGHVIQSRALAEALGWPFEIKQLRFNRWQRLSNKILGAGLHHLDREHSAALAPPWPDLVISVGGRSASVARWIGAQSAAGSRLVHLGRKGGEVADDFDLTVACSHFRQFAHPRRMQTIAPLNPLDDDTLQAAAERWRGLFADAPGMRIALIVGGDSALHRLDDSTARTLGREVCAFAEPLGASVFAITSPRTGITATDALSDALGPENHVHRWRADEQENPYRGYLALADIIIVTGESESMLSEAAATGKPLLIYPLPEVPPVLRARVAEAVMRRSRKPRINKRGTIRPQRGLQYLCARLIDRGWVRPRRDLKMLHQALVEAGVAQMFGEALKPGERPALREAETVAARVRRMMGLGDE
jgi:mitochondrial fission protein ELM1